MDAQMEALKRKRQAVPDITILVDDPKKVEVKARDGAEAPSSEEDQRENPDVAPGVYDKGEQAEELEDVDAVGKESASPGVTLTPGAPADPNSEASEMDPSEIFDEPETMRRKADGQGKPRSLTDRAAFAAFKGRKK